MQNRPRNEEETEKDSLFGWVVVGAAFIVSFLTDGMCFSFGILLVEFLEVFQESRAITSAIYSIAYGVLHLIGPLAGALCDNFGCRKIVIAGSLLSCIGLVLSIFANGIISLCFTFGLIGGIGFGLMQLPASVCVIQHFHKRKTLAFGLHACGSGIGTFAFSHLTSYLLDTYGWRGTLLLEAGILLHGTVCGLLLIQPTKSTKNKLEKTTVYTLDNVEQTNSDVTEPPELKTDATNENKKCFKLSAFCLQVFVLKLLTDVRFLCFLVSIFITNLAISVPILFLPDQAETLNISSHLISWLSASIGISSALGRIVFGWLGDRKHFNRLVLFEMQMFVMGICTLVSSFLLQFVAKLTYACIFGLLFGGFVALHGVVLVDMFGEEIISKSFGLSYFAIGVSGLVTGPISPDGFST